MLVFVLIFINFLMFMLVNKLISYIELISNFFRNITKLSLKQTYKNNLGSFKFKFFSDRVSKYKFFLYFYIFITMALCPWLDNLFNFWYDSETYNIYYIIFFCSVINYFLNKYLIIPSKDMLNFRLFFLHLKSLYFYLNRLYIKFFKNLIFFKNEVFKKSYIYNFIKSNWYNLSNYFIYWRPLFKRFSYFGYYRLTKSKFFKINRFE